MITFLLPYCAPLESKELTPSTLIGHLIVFETLDRDYIRNWEKRDLKKNFIENIAEIDLWYSESESEK